MKKHNGVIAMAAAMLISGSMAYAQEGIHLPAPAGLDVHFGFPGTQGLNELLVKKGIITKEELDEQAKKHSLNISGYIQFQGSVIENNEAMGTDGKALSDADGFRIRRAKLAVFGNAYEHVKFKLEANLVGVKDNTRKDNAPSLDDAYIEDDHFPILTGKIGQFKVPFSLEELTSDTEILSIERSEVVKQLAPGRDQGISFVGDIPGGLFSYSIGAFNGSKPSTASTYQIGAYEDSAKNKTNENDQLLYAGRLVVKPAGSLKIGMNGLTSDDGTGSAHEIRTSYGIDLQVKNAKSGCQLQGEYLKQRLDRTGEDVTSEGFYVQAGHFVVPKHLEIALKYEGYDADTDHRNRDDIRWTTVGINFYMDGNDAKLMANYIFKDEGRDSYDNDTFFAQLQLRF